MPSPIPDLWWYSIDDCELGIVTDYGDEWQCESWIQWLLSIVRRFVCLFVFYWSLAKGCFGSCGCCTSMSIHGAYHHPFPVAMFNYCWFFSFPVSLIRFFDLDKFCLAFIIHIFFIRLFHICTLLFGYFSFRHFLHYVLCSMYSAFFHLDLFRFSFSTK